MNVPERKLNLLIDEDEMARRRATWKAPEPKFSRGWCALYQSHVSQANEGCDFDFLETIPVTDITDQEPGIH